MKKTIIEIHWRSVDKETPPENKRLYFTEDGHRVHKGMYIPNPNGHRFVARGMEYFDSIKYFALYKEDVNILVNK